MYRFRMIYILIVMCVFFTGCTNNSQPSLLDTEHSSVVIDETELTSVTTQTTTTSSIDSYDTPIKYTLSDSQIATQRNCKLIINGKDITNNNYVKIRIDDKVAELPLLAIMKELGAEVKWENEKSVSMIFHEKTLNFDVSKWDLDILVPPGAIGVRKIINNELVYDYDSVKYLLKMHTNSNISINYDDMIISIDTVAKTGDGSLS